MLPELSAAETNAVMSPIFGHSSSWTFLADLRTRARHRDCQKTPLRGSYRKASAETHSNASEGASNGQHSSPFEPQRRWRIGGGKTLGKACGKFELYDAVHEAVSFIANRPWTQVWSCR